MKKALPRMSKPAVYRKAAKFVDEHDSGCCWALKVSCGSYFDPAFKDLFGFSRSGYWWEESSYSRNARVIALLLMALIAKEGTK